jgi:hypothetical protein
MVEKKEYGLVRPDMPDLLGWRRNWSVGGAYYFK